MCTSTVHIKKDVPMFSVIAFFYFELYTKHVPVTVSNNGITVGGC